MRGFTSERALAILTEESYTRHINIVSDTEKGLSALFWALILIIAIPVAILILRRVLQILRNKMQKTWVEDMLSDAKGHIDKGEFVSAGLIYEKLKNLEESVILYEKGRDFRRAASVYESLNMITKAKEMYEKAGDLENAVRLSITLGDYIEAARLYKQKGDKLKSAEAFQLGGMTLEAVREYREAGDYISAAMILKEEGFLKESAQMYSLALTEETISTDNIDKYSTYALLLEEAGDIDVAISVFKQIIALDPNYRDVKKRLENIGVHKKTTLRGIIQAGRMEPKQGMKLWVKILKALNQKHKEGVFFGMLNPEGIFIDTNSVSFKEGANHEISETYSAPEVISGRPPEIRADIYSMGIILYELLTGRLHDLWVKSPSEVMPDIPLWLDELAMKCIEKDSMKRYQDINEVLLNLKEIKKAN